MELLDCLGKEEGAYEVFEQRRVLAPAMGHLDERERLILHLRFFEGMTQTQVAARVGISQMHVSRLIRKSIEKLRHYMLDGGQWSPSDLNDESGDKRGGGRDKL